MKSKMMTKLLMEAVILNFEAKGNLVLDSSLLSKTVAE